MCRTMVNPYEMVFGHNEGMVVTLFECHMSRQRVLGLTSVILGVALDRGLYETGAGKRYVLAPNPSR
jgi:hypothetical protein